MNKFIKSLQDFEGADVIIKRKDGTTIKGMCESINYNTSDFVIATKDELIIVTDIAEVRMRDEDPNEEEYDDEPEEEETNEE